MAMVVAEAMPVAMAVTEGMAVAMAVTVAEATAVAMAVALAVAMAVAVVMPMDVVPLPSPRPTATCHRYPATATPFSVEERNLSMIHVEKRVSLSSIEKRSALILYIGNAGNLLSIKGISLFSVLRMRDSPVTEGMAVAMAVTVADATAVSMAVASAVAMAVAMPVDVAPLPSPRPQASRHRYPATATPFSVEEKNLSMIHGEKRVSLFAIEKRSVIILYIGNAGSLLSRKGVSLFSVLRMRDSLPYIERRILSILY